MTSTDFYSLDAQMLWNTLQHYRTDSKKQFRIVFAIAWLGFMLWQYLFRHMIAKPAGFLAHWEAIRHVAPVALATMAAGFGAYNRLTQWLSRWCSGSFSVLPVEPRGLAGWLLGATFLLDLGWLLLGLVVSIGTAYILKLDWFHEFPFMLLGALLLIAVASVAKTFAAMLLRLGSARFLNWPNWVLKWLGRLLAMVFLQALVAFWWIAEYARPDSPVVAAIALSILAGAAVGLALLARALLINRWNDLAASFELQQTKLKVKGRVPLASFIANRFRSPIARLVTLYNLRTGMQMNRWGGQQVTLGGRRLTVLIVFFFLILFMLSVMYLPDTVDPNDMLLPTLLAAVWASMSSAMAMPPALPPYRLLRQLPVSFPQWLWSMAALPLFYSGILVVIAAVGMARFDPSNALRSCGIVFGVYLGIAPLRLGMISAFPEGQQTSEFLYMLIVGAAGMLTYYVSWMAAAALLLAANIYFYYRAARTWRGREEGLSV
jgi:hypothetical protein